MSLRWRGLVRLVGGISLNAPQWALSNITRAIFPRRRGREPTACGLWEDGTVAGWRQLTDEEEAGGCFANPAAAVCHAYGFLSHARNATIRRDRFARAARMHLHDARPKLRQLLHARGMPYCPFNSSDSGCQHRNWTRPKNAHGWLSRLFTSLKPLVQSRTTRTVAPAKAKRLN
jgi:hypothetical protein